MKINNKEISNDNKLTVFGGVNVIESDELLFQVAEKFKEISEKYDFNYVFKASFDKANRSSLDSFRGPGLDEGLESLQKVKDRFDLPLITDIHEPDQAKSVADVCDVIQIPAFLCRQTDLLLSAAKTNKIINVKKGQFLSPYEVPNIFKKIESEGNNKIMITERGTSFGYNNLINDFKSLDVMKSFSYPVIFDATHSVQEPGGLGEKSGGKREFVTTLSKAAAAVGVAGIFIETHNDPDNAPSDGPNMLHLENLENLISKLIEFDNITKK